MTEPMVTVRLPLASWNQIVSDIENMCGTQAANIEILQEAEILGTEIPTICTCPRGRADFSYGTAGPHHNPDSCPLWTRL